MDRAITQWINSLAGSNVLLDSAMIMATNAGVPLLVALVAAQWWSKIDRTHVRHTCIAAGLSFLIGLGLNQIIRNRYEAPTSRSRDSSAIQPGMS
jgi:undecaprenyl-diphosphatase